jgi:hypothetical protein
MRTRWIPLVVAAPAVLGALVWVGLLVVSLATGTHPVWSSQPRSLDQAAQMRDAGAVVRFIEQGARMTPAEAAAASHDRDIVRLIIDEMAASDGAP